MRDSPADEPLVVGSEEHKRLLCRWFLDSHDPYRVEDIQWPDLQASALQKLRGLPFWGDAVGTEREVAAKVSALAPLERDPLVREAIELQGFEEARHSELLRRMTRHYELPLDEPALPPLPTDLEWGFLRTGYGECFDSFFGFGLFTFAKGTGLFAPALLETVEPVIAEEARHIVFFVNWIAYRRAQMPLWRRPVDRLRCAAAVGVQIVRRIQSAVGIDNDEFLSSGHSSFDFDVSFREVLELCLSENDRRLAGIDPRLLRPRLTPALARAGVGALRLAERVPLLRDRLRARATSDGQP